MNYEQAYEEFIQMHIASRTGERRGRLIEGIGMLKPCSNIRKYKFSVYFAYISTRNGYRPIADGKPFLLVAQCVVAAAWRFL